MNGLLNEGVVRLRSPPQFPFPDSSGTPFPIVTESTSINDINDLCLN